MKKRQILKRTTRGSGQSLLETVVGALILIPLALMCVDALAVINANHSNQELAQTAARAAANNADHDAARKIAEQTVSDFAKSNLISNVSIASFDFNAPLKLVTVSLSMTVNVPVPLPFASSVRLSASSTQPIVALPPSV